MRVLKLAVYLMTGAVLLPAFVAAQHVNTESAGARAHFVMGMKSFDMAKFDDARSHLDKAIEMDPNFAAAHLYRTWVATSADDWKAHYDRARALRESATPWVQNMIDRSVAGADNDGERQLELALALVAEYPTSARAFDYLASEYSQHKMYDAERGALKTAMALDPGYSPAYKSLSLSYVFNQPEDHEAALKYGKKYVKHAPDAADAYIVFGDVHRARNDFQKASDAYAMAIEVDPDHATAYSKKGHADTYLGAFEAARADFAAAEKVAKTLGQRVGQKNFAVYTHLYAGDVSAAMQANTDVIDGLKKMDSDEATGPLRTTYRDRVLIAAHHGMFDEAMAAHSEMVKHTKSMTERVN
ncbi:MAG: hypothetical protein KJO98_07510, partial [Rhodothermia bacterium]|nr:hypothetical protein [Rhodothermia bacterium]